MSANILMPPSLKGTIERQLQQLYSYLYQMNGQINAALSSLTIEQLDASSAEAIRLAASAANTQAKEQQELKAIIIKTADNVKSEMDILKQTLRTDYVASSDFGVYQRNISAEIIASAENVVTSYGYAELISGVRDALNALDQSVVQMNGYIKSGIIGYDEDNAPLLGIAIGQGIRVSGTDTVGDETYDIISKPSHYATYTANGLAFWRGETRVAYMEKDTLFITRAHITDTLVMGMGAGKWRSDFTDGYVIKYIG